MKALSARRRGFTLVEVIMAAFLLLIGCVTLITVFSGSLRRSAQSMNRSAAIVLAQSMLDEVEAHRYGSRAPRHWPVDQFRVDNPMEMWVDGKPQTFAFHCQLRFENGGAIGASGSDNDVATVIVTWKEDGGAISRDYGKFNSITYPADNQKIVASLPIWR